MDKVDENKVYRKLIEVETRLGFLAIPKKNEALFPKIKEKVKIISEGEKYELSYNPEHRRVFGLTPIYRKNKASIGDLIILSKQNDTFYLEIKKQTITEDEKEEEEAKEIMDLSGLSTQAKGDIVEDRIKELVLLHGLGSLNVYKPVIDVDGVDLIVSKKGHFHPIFIQSKGRYVVSKNKQIILRVKVSTFTAHRNYFVVGAFFNPKTLELDNNLLLIPSKEIEKEAGIVSTKNGEWYNIPASLNKDSNSKWSKFIIDKTDLASRLIELLEEIDEFVK